MAHRECENLYLLHILMLDLVGGDTVLLNCGTLSCCAYSGLENLGVDFSPELDIC